MFFKGFSPESEERNEKTYKKYIERQKANFAID